MSGAGGEVEGALLSPRPARDFQSYAWRCLRRLDPHSARTGECVNGVLDARIRVEATAVIGQKKKEMEEEIRIWVIGFRSQVPYCVLDHPCQVANLRGSS